MSYKSYFLVFLSILIYFFLFNSNDETKKRDKYTNNDQLELIAAQSPSKLNTIKKPARKKRVSNSKPKEGPISQLDRCQNIWKEVVLLNNLDLLKFIGSESHNRSHDSCAPKLDRDSAMILSHSLSQCSGNYKDINKGFNTPCSKALMSLRYLIVDRLSSKEDISGLPVEVMAAKLLNKVTLDPPKTTKERVDLINIGIEMVTRTEGSEKAIDALSLSLSSAMNDTDVELEIDIDEIIQEAKSLNLKNSNIQELELERELHSNDESFFNERLKNSPNDHRALYYYAWYKFKSGDFEASEFFLRKAIYLSNGNQRYKDSLVNLTNGRQQPFYNTYSNL